jgi:hypothetical protein
MCPYFNLSFFCFISRTVNGFLKDKKEGGNYSERLLKKFFSLFRSSGDISINFTPAR